MLHILFLANTLFSDQVVKAKPNYSMICEKGFYRKSKSIPELSVSLYLELISEPQTGYNQISLTYTLIWTHYSPNCTLGYGAD